MPSPLRDLMHEAGPAPPDLAREHGAEPVDPKADAFMTNVNSALMQKVLDIPERDRKAHLHHDRKLDDLRRRFEIAKWVAGHRRPCRRLD